MKDEQYSTVQYSTVQYSAVQYSTVQCSTVQAQHMHKKNMRAICVSIFAFVGCISVSLWFLLWRVCLGNGGVVSIFVPRKLK